eukprot:769739-Pyramimonas_sp.AAC.1
MKPAALLRSIQTVSANQVAQSQSSEKNCLDDLWPRSTRSCAMKRWQVVASENEDKFWEAS